MEYQKDITGYGRKMGLNAGGNGEGKINRPVYLGPNDGPDGDGDGGPQPPSVAPGSAMWDAISHDEWFHGGSDESGIT